jgi:hypothetical protein
MRLMGRIDEDSVISYRYNRVTVTGFSPLRPSFGSGGLGTGVKLESSQATRYLPPPFFPRPRQRNKGHAYAMTSAEFGAAIFQIIRR